MEDGHFFLNALPHRSNIPLLQFSKSGKRAKPLTEVLPEYAIVNNKSNDFWMLDPIQSPRAS